MREFATVSLRLPSYFLLVLVQLACSTGQLRESQQKPRSYPLLEGTPLPVAGSTYRLSGIYYRDWEDSGLIPRAKVKPEEIELATLHSYCTTFDSASRKYLGPHLIETPSGYNIIGAKLLVVFDGEVDEAERRARGMQCGLGAVHVIGILSLYNPLISNS